MVKVNENCVENITTGDFSVIFESELQSCQVLPTFLSSVIQLNSSSTCLPFHGNLSDGWCYRVTLTYQGTVIDTQTNYNFATCSISELEDFVGTGVTYQLAGSQNQDGTGVSHLTTVTFSCSETFSELSGVTQTTCMDGQWVDKDIRLCLQMYTGTYHHSILMFF